MAPSRLLDLPMETIMMVIKELCIHCFDPGPGSVFYPGRRDDVKAIRQSALAALALTSRQLNMLVTPHLYHEPTGDWSLLMRTLIERPDLVPHVKSLEVGEGSPSLDCFEKISGGNVIVDALNAKIEERAEGAFGEYEEDDDIESCDEDMKDSINIADFLIALCPNMSHLDIALHVFGPRFSMVGDGALADLKHAYLSSMDTESGWEMSLISRLPRIAPNLSTLVCSYIDGPADFSDKFENVTHLDLTDCSIQTGVLESILRAFPRLESFHFWAGDACVSFEPHLSMREMQDALTVYTPGLKRLNVGLGLGVHPDRVDMPDLWSSLSGLTKLEHLEFDYMCIFPYFEQKRVVIIDGQPTVPPSHVPGRNVFVDLLPRSIRTVRFEHGPVVGAAEGRPAYLESMDGLFPALEYLSSVAAEKFPSLRRFEVVNAWQLPGDTSSIKSVMEASGIEFVAGVQPNPGYRPSADELMFTARWSATHPDTTTGA